jgi:hypothetical protein
MCFLCCDVVYQARMAKSALCIAILYWLIDNMSESLRDVYK